jgi:hypothetical protein
MKIKPFRKITKSSFIKDNYLIMCKKNYDDIQNFIKHLKPIRRKDKIVKKII